MPRLGSFTNPFVEVKLMDIVITKSGLSSLLEASNERIKELDVENIDYKVDAASGLDITKYIQAISISKQAWPPTGVLITITLKPPYDDAIALLSDLRVLMPLRVVKVTIGYLDSSTLEQSTNKKEFVGVLKPPEITFHREVSIKLTAFEPLVLSAMRATSRNLYQVETGTDVFDNTREWISRGTTDYIFMEKDNEYYIKGRPFAAVKEIIRQQYPNIDVINPDFNGENNGFDKFLGRGKYYYGTTEADNGLAYPSLWYQRPDETIYQFISRICLNCSVAVSSSFPDSVTKESRIRMTFSVIAPERESILTIAGNKPNYTFLWRRAPTGVDAESQIPLIAIDIPPEAIGSMYMANSVEEIAATAFSSDTGTFVEAKNYPRASDDSDPATKATNIKDANSNTTMWSKSTKQGGERRAAPPSQVVEVIGAAARIIALLKNASISATVPGLPQLEVGNLIGILGTETMYDGAYILSSFEHAYDSNGFITKTGLIKLRTRPKEPAVDRISKSVSKSIIKSFSKIDINSIG